MCSLVSGLQSIQLEMQENENVHSFLMTWIWIFFLFAAGDVRVRRHRIIGSSFESQWISNNARNRNRQWNKISLSFMFIVKEIEISRNMIFRAVPQDAAISTISFSWLCRYCIRLLAECSIMSSVIWLAEVATAIWRRRRKKITKLFYIFVRLIAYNWMVIRFWYLWWTNNAHDWHNNMIYWLKENAPHEKSP